MISGAKALIAVAGLVVAGSTVAIVASGNADEGKVVRVIDGDTLVVDFDDQELTVRLLNVDTPETKDPGKPVECLGPEATDFLTEALPAGSTVTLAFDVEREDRYGRTLAAVYNDDDLLINAEVARRGLGIPVTVGKNTKFRPPVDEAYQEAQEQHAGLFAEDVGCTVPAMVAALEETASQAASQGTGTTAVAAGAAVTAVYALAKTVDAGFDAFEASAKAGESLIWAALTPAQKADLQARANTAQTQVHDRHDELVTVQAELQASEDEVKRKAAEAERIAAEEEARKVAAAAQAEADRLAAEQAEAHRIAAEAEARRIAAAQAEADRQAAYTPPPQQYVPPAPSSNPPGYTGPRCYAPGGKTWRPC